MERSNRKPVRLPNFDYSTPGAYFITLCTQDRKNLLGKVVGGGALDAPQVALSPIGIIADKYIRSSSAIPGVTVDKYIIMPNHIHMLLFVSDTSSSGTSKAPSPTNAVIPHFVSTLKRFCHRDAGFRLFQRSYHDHVIRGESDYLKIWNYIDGNAAKWEQDCFYTTDEINGTSKAPSPTRRNLF